MLEESIPSEEALDAARLRKTRWSDYNADLLRTLFHDDRIVGEYVRFPGIAFARARLADRVNDYRHELRESVGRLESIVERLQLFSEPGSEPSVGAGQVGAREPTRGRVEQRRRSGASGANADGCLVFISHVGAEREVALALQVALRSAIPGIEVFVSSDPDSIRAGDRWLDEITTALQTCIVQIVIASPASVGRAWINFEAGAAWLRGIRIIPVCHSGMSPGTLPVPLGLSQGGLLTDAAYLASMFRTIARDCGTTERQVPADRFAQSFLDLQADLVAAGTSTLPSTDADVPNRSIPELRALSAERRSLERDFYDRILELQTLRTEGRRVTDASRLAQLLDIVGRFWASPAELGDADIANGIAAAEAVIDDLRATATPDIRNSLLRSFYDHDLAQAPSTSPAPISIDEVSRRLAVSQSAVQRRLRELVSAGLVELSGGEAATGEGESRMRITEAGRLEIESLADHGE
jgi:hypothetical protein